jgi:hypothetical protein
MSMQVAPASAPAVPTRMTAEQQMQQQQQKRLSARDQALRFIFNWRNSPSPPPSPTSPSPSGGEPVRRTRSFFGRRAQTLDPIPQSRGDEDDDDPVNTLLRGLERQNQRLSADPKSIQLHDNGLKAGTSTILSLVSLTPSKSTSPLAASASLDDPLTLLPGESTNSYADDLAVAPTRIAGCASPEALALIPQAEIDFWLHLVDDMDQVQQQTPHLLAHKLRQGIPSALRGRVWRRMLNGHLTGLESKYRKLVLERTEYSKIIQRDLARTFPGVPLFSAIGGEGQRALGRIMRAYSVYDPELGYCQGLGFLVGPLLMNMSEVESFCTFVKLMATQDLRSMFLPTMRGLHIRLHQLTQTIRLHMPELHAHMENNAVPTALYASQWFLTLFAYTYPLRFVLRVWDIAVCEGWAPTVLRIGMALLSLNKDKLMACEEFEEIVRVLTKGLCMEECTSSDNSVELVVIAKVESIIEESVMWAKKGVASDEFMVSCEREFEQEEEKRRVDKVKRQKELLMGEGNESYGRARGSTTTAIPSEYRHSFVI